MNRKKFWLLAGAALALCGTVVAQLLMSGILPFNRPSRTRYPVRGVDVSKYQGIIDWPTLAAQDVNFAFIKATEGSMTVDPRHAGNWQGARAAGLRVGAYHFFSFDSPGDTQAALFIETVEPFDGMLPPVVDVEFYGSYKRKPKDAAEVWPELDALLGALEVTYGVKPILYATETAYARYLNGRYDDYPLWIRSVYRAPRLPGGREWIFWQYSARGRLAGFDGEEKFIDLNVFSGTTEEFEAFGRNRP